MMTATIAIIGLAMRARAKALAPVAARRNAVPSPLNPALKIFEAIAAPRNTVSPFLFTMKNKLAVSLSILKPALIAKIDLAANKTPAKLAARATIVCINT